MIRWFTENRVASDLLMVAIILGGLLSFPLLDREVMPAVPLDMIEVNVDYPGASPAEIEERICIRIEEAIHDLEGIDTILSEAVDGRGGVSVQVEKGYETRQVLADIKSRVDAIDNLPAGAEEPEVREAPFSEEMIELVLSADTDEETLRDATLRVRDEVARLPGVDQVEVDGIRQPEMAIEVSELSLRKYNLSFDDVVQAIRGGSVNLPGGSIRADSGDVALLTRSQAYSAQDYRELVVLKGTDGTRVLLGDVADVRDTFEEVNELSRFNGKSAATITVKVRNNPDVVAVNEAVREYAQAAQASMPSGMELDIWLDRSEIFRSRSTMLIQSGALGLAMVFVLLTLFLRPKIAAWVCVGIAVSFLGAIWMIPSTPISMNMMTLFAFILVLGIVVDDAIIIGESIHASHEQGLTGKEAAIEGARRVSKPVIFAAVTTMVAFSPALFIDGSAAKLTMPLSVVVILCLIFSLIDAFFILPAHLGRMKPLNEEDASTGLGRVRRRVAAGLKRFSEQRYGPFLQKAMRNRYVTLAGFIATWMIIMSFVQGGWVKQVFYPMIPGDNVMVRVTLSDGIAFDTTERVVAQIEDAASTVRAQLESEKGFDVVRNLHTMARENNITVNMELLPGEDRDLPAEYVAEVWREAIGYIPDTKSYTFDYHLVDRESPVKLGLTADDPAVLRQATRDVEERLATYDGLYGINNSQRSARTEIEVQTRASAENLGVDRNEVARQVRQGFFGEEVQRIPRGRDEVKVMVRYPYESRQSLEQLNRMRIRVGEDQEVPIGAVAELQFGQGASSVRRMDRRRIVEVTAEADYRTADPARIVQELREGFLIDLERRYPGLEILVEGEQDSAGEFLAELVRLTLMAFLFTFGLIAIAFRSYIQPALVMSAVPFGLLGSVVGHLVFGTTMSMFSFMGVVAAAGVVINDNLVLIDRINQLREQGQAVAEAVYNAAVSRFRPILLTSFTTFVGLLPIMSERSSQSEYLKPMTLSLGFGVAFASFVTLLLVPCLYLVVEDLRERLSWRGVQKTVPRGL